MTDSGSLTDNSDGPVLLGMTQRQQHVVVTEEDVFNSTTSNEEDDSASCILGSAMARVSMKSTSTAGTCRTSVTTMSSTAQFRRRSNNDDDAEADEDNDIGDNSSNSNNNGGITTHTHNSSSNNNTHDTNDFNSGDLSVLSDYSKTSTTVNSINDPSSIMPVSMLQEEENYDNEQPSTLQEELNEILEAFYEMVSDEDIYAYQEYVENIQNLKIAENALQEPSLAPDFELIDQDGDVINLYNILESKKQSHSNGNDTDSDNGGCVILVFYRGKWCPHCNATLMRYQKDVVPYLKEHHNNTTMIAISPMLPDGTAYLATKRDLQFSVCSDTNNDTATKYKLTFVVNETTRPFMTKWGEHVPSHNGNDEWTIPLPATYVINTNKEIIWSFVDNDPGIRAEPKDILAALPKTASSSLPSAVVAGGGGEESEVISTTQPSYRRKSAKLFNRKIGFTFAIGKKKSKTGRRQGGDNSVSSSMEEGESSVGDSSSIGGHDDSSILTDDGNISTRSAPAMMFSQNSSNHSSSNKQMKKGNNSDTNNDRKQQEQKRPSLPGRRRHKPKRAQSAKEFLGKYLLMGG